MVDVQCNYSEETIRVNLDGELDVICDEALNVCCSLLDSLGATMVDNGMNSEEAFSIVSQIASQINNSFAPQSKYLS